MHLLAFLLGITFFSLSVSAQEPEVNLDPESDTYIADNLIVYMHSGPGRNYRILGSIEAGLPVTILQTDTDKAFSQIKDGEGREGWVENQYLINTISRRVQLPLLSQRLADSEQAVNRLQSRNTSLSQDLAQSRQSIAELESDLSSAQETVNRLQAQVDAQDTQERYRMFTYGGIVAGAGVILGIVVTFIPKRRRRNDSWM